MRQKSCCQTDGTEEVGGYDGFSIGKITLLRLEIFRPHNSRIINQDIQLGMVGGNLLGKGRNGIGILDVECDGGHAGIGVCGFVQDLLATSGDNDFIAESIKSFGEATANAGTAARDENGIVSKLHRMIRGNVSGGYNVVNGNMLQFVPRPCKVLVMKASSRPYHHGHLREALLREAESALVTGGVKSISLRELSRELGVSHTSPRRHFADKQALLDALAQRGFERFDLTLGRAARDRGQDFKARLTKLTRAYVNFALKYPALLGLMFEDKHRVDAPPELLVASEKAFSHAAMTFAEGQDAGEVVSGDPGRLSLVVFAAMQGLIAISTDGKFKGIPLDTLVGEIIERIILGLRPRP